MKRISSIRTLFWGLLLVFIDIKINNFDILNDILGYFIIICALYELAEYSKLFLKGLRYAQINLAWKIFSVILSYSEFSKQLEIIMSVIGVILDIVMTYHIIITGLSELANNQGLTYLPESLNRGYRIYLIALLLYVISISISPSAIWFLILTITIIIYIYLLVQVYAAYYFISIDETDNINIEESDNSIKSRIKITALLIILPIVLGIGVIGLSERQTIYTQPFNNNDLDENQDQNQISSVRTKMVDLGIEADVVDSMPDSEILLYKNIKKVQSCKSDEISCDGGKLEISQYVNSLDSKIYRYIAYYKWLEKPKRAYAEVLGIVQTQNDSIILNNMEFSSLNLYDIKDKEGNIQVYTSNDIEYEKNSLPQKKFKLTDSKNADNYRGYIAFNINAKGSVANNNFFFYIHQSTIFNNRGMDIIDLNKDKHSFSSENEDLFLKEYYIKAMVDLE